MGSSVLKVEACAATQAQINLVEQDGGMASIPDYREEPPPLVECKIPVPDPSWHGIHSGD
jgi:hypothetical protein